VSRVTWLLSHIFVKRARARSHSFVKVSNFDFDERVTAMSLVRQDAHPKLSFLRASNMQGYDPINKGYTVEQHRVANYFENQTNWYKFSTWPAWLQDAALVKVKDFNQRSTMFIHLVRNNVWGPTARTWTLASDVIDGKLIWDAAYPESVRYDMARLVKKALENPDSLVNPDVNTYSHELGRVVKGLQPGHSQPYPPKRAISTPAPIQRPAPGPVRQRPQPRKVPGIYYPPQQRQSHRRLTSGIRFVRTSRQGRGDGYYVTDYGGTTYRLH